MKKEGVAWYRSTEMKKHLLLELDIFQTIGPLERLLNNTVLDNGIIVWNV